MCICILVRKTNNDKYKSISVKNFINTYSTRFTVCFLINGSMKIFKEYLMVPSEPGLIFLQKKNLS